MDSVATAFEAALEQAPKYTKSPPRSKMSDAQSRYAMKVSYSIARRHWEDGAQNYEDLAMCAVERIVLELSKHDHLWHYNAWMGNVAKWAIATELQRMKGRPGLTKQGKRRAVKRATYSMDYMTPDGLGYHDRLYENETDHDLRLTVEDTIEGMPEHHKPMLRLLQFGYNYAEVSRILGVTPACITIRMRAVRKNWPEECV